MRKNPSSHGRRASKRLRIMVIYHNDLLGEGVSQFLQGLNVLDVSTVNTVRQDAMQLLREVEPDIVMLEVDGSKLEATQIMEERPGITVLTFKLTDNTMTIFSKRQVSVSRPEELVDAILSFQPSVKIEPARTKLRHSSGAH